MVCDQPFLNYFLLQNDTLSTSLAYCY